MSTLSCPHYRRSAFRRAIAASSGLALALLIPSGLVDSPSASASGAAWYAYAGGEASSPASCPQAAVTTSQCTLAEALLLAGPGDTVYLATAGTSGHYIGNWAISATGTSASEPLTVEPAPSVTSPILDGNGGSSTNCTTTAVGCNGPVLTIGDAYVDLSGVTIEDAYDTAPGYGGGIANNQGGTLSVNGCTFSADQAAYDGGAIDSGDGGTGTLNVAGSTFSGNVAAANGGAIDSGDNGGNGILSVASSTFSQNTATYFDGGAIDSGDRSGTGTLSVSGSTFSANFAGQEGGAIGNGLALFGPSSRGTATVTETSFTDNSAAYNGGAIDSGDANGTGSLTVTGSTFSGNTATMGDGGAINNGDYSGSGALTATSTTFSGNASSGDGGAIDSGDNTGHGSLVVTGSTFTTNNADQNDGGAIDSGDNGGTGTLTATSSTFSANGAASDGGAIDSGDDSASSTAAIVASSFAANTLTNTTNTSPTHDGATLDNGDNGGTSTLTVAADIFDGSCDNTAGGTWVDDGYNVGSDASCFSPAVPGTDSDSAGSALASLLGPVAANGGPTQTMLPLAGNPSIGIVPNPTSASFDGTSLALCPTTDQRGVESVPGQACDAGSVQVPLPMPLAQAYSTLAGTELTEPAGTLQTGVSDGNSGATSWTSQLSSLPGNGAAVVNRDGSFTYTPVAGFVGTDSFTYSLTDNLGYTSAPTTITVNVGPGFSITAGGSPTAASLTYGSALTLAEAGVAASSTRALVFSTTSGGLCTIAFPTSTASCVSAVGLAPGTYAVTADLNSTATSGTTPANNSVQLTVGPAPLSVTASSASMAAGGAVPVISPTYSGFVMGDSGASLSTPPACTTTATSSSPPGNYPSTCSRAVDADYAISYLAGTVTVTAAPATAAAPTSSSPAVPTSTAPPTTPAKTFPAADITYPNGAIVEFGRRDYVLAGGRAFAASASGLGAVEKVDHAKLHVAPTGAVAPTATAVRAGTMLSTRAVNGKATIFVTGADGELHGFSTSGQLSRDGYDTALVVTVPSLGGLRVGSTAGLAGASLTALATRADGAVVDSSGTFYVFAGGRAFGISTPSEVPRLRKTDQALMLHGSVGSAATRAAIASGVLLSAPGRVYVSYQGALYRFKTTAQLASDGYGGTAAVPVPGTGPLRFVPT